MPECCPPLMTSPSITSTTANTSTAPTAVVTEYPSSEYMTFPLIVVMTPAPTPASMVETMQELSTTGTLFENQCIICPGGITAIRGDEWKPLANFGEDWTCVEIIDDAKDLPVGSVTCGHFESIAIECCIPTEIENPYCACPSGP